MALLERSPCLKRAPIEKSCFYSIPALTFIWLSKTTSSGLAITKSCSLYHVVVIVFIFLLKHWKTIISSLWSFFLKCSAPPCGHCNIFTATSFEIFKWHALYIRDLWLVNANTTKAKLVLQGLCCFVDFATKNNSYKQN